MATFDSGGGSEEDDQQEDQERGVVADEGGTQDPAGAADELAGRDPGSGGGGGGAGGGGRTRDPRQQADEQLTQRDPGRGGRSGRGGAGGGAAGGSAAEEELTQRDPGSSQASRDGAGSADSTTQQTERAFVERQIDATLQEGLEGRAGGGRRQEAAREFEREIVEQSDRVDDPSDVAIVERDGKLEAELSRSAQVDMTVEEFDLKEEIVRGFKRDRRPKGQGLTPGSAVSPLAEGIDVGDIEEVTMDDAGELDVTVSEDFIEQAEPAEPLEGDPVDSPTAGSSESGFIERNRESVSPHSTLSLKDDEALDARLEKEQEMFELAESDPTPIDFLPGFGNKKAAAQLGAGGKLVGQGLVDAGSAIEEKTTFGVGPKVGGEALGDVPGNLAGGIVGFAGMGVSAGAQAPFSIREDIETELEGGETPTEIEGGGLDITENFAESQVELFQERPVSTTVGLALPLAPSVPAGIKGFRSTRGTKGTVKLGDVTTEPAAKSGELPRFETRPGESTAKATREVRQRARDQPDAVDALTEADQVLYHTTENPLKGDLTVAEGASELPGIFTSPDVSPLRLSTAAEQSRPRVGFGDYSVTPEQVAAFEAAKIRGMPESAAGSGYGVRRGATLTDTGLTRAQANRIVAEKGGQRVPDPTTSGSKFLRGEAERGAGFVRPRGSRTSELEAVLPPESRFTAGERLGVEMPSGEIVPMDIFRGGDQPAPSGVSDLPGSTTAAEVSSRYTPLESAGSRGQPAVNIEATSGAAGAAGSGISGLESSTTGFVSVEPVSPVISEIESSSVTDSVTSDLNSLPSDFGPSSGLTSTAPSSSPPSATGGTSGGSSGPPSISEPVPPTGIETSPPNRPTETPPGPPTDTPPGPSTGRPPGPPGGPDTPPPLEFDLDLDGVDKERRKPRFEFFKREFVYEFEGEPGQVADDLLAGDGLVDLGGLDDLGDLGF